MSDIAISVSNVSKCYRVFDERRSRLLDALWPKHIKDAQEIRALKDINFEVKRGESVAIIGRNGSGKSTLLEILTGTLVPTRGSVVVNGRVSALLELGCGFNPDYSGRDNVILNGMLLGLSKGDILSRFDEIEAFAEIGAAIDHPVKTYSSGMTMRLAFAVQVLCDPDILIIDEALSVGDFFFQQKCLNYIRELSAKGVTLLFVSHDMGVVRDLCSRVVYLLSGEQKFDGDTIQGVSLYFRGADSDRGLTQGHESENDSISDKTNQAPQSLSDQLVDPIWELDTETPLNCKAKILEVGMYDQHGKPVTNFQIGQSIQLRLRYQIFCDVPVHIGFFIKNKYDQVVNATTSYTLALNPPELKWGESSYFGADIICNLEAGEYSITCTLGVEIAMMNQGESLFETPPLGPFRITWDYSDKVAPFFGMVGLPVNAFFGPIDQNRSK